MNIPYVKVIQLITIHKNESYYELQTQIQSRLEVLFNNILLKICIIQAGSIIKKEMDIYEDSFSDYFIENPKAEYFHIIIYPPVMQSEIDLLRQCITELKAENAKISELRKKLAKVEARNVEIEAKNAELIKQIMKENIRCDIRIENTTDRIVKLE
ncbi:hypothetical protein C1645_813668 [Glomus cerebriforme]|uniref:Uncharacterized protein n=1 Tax=Glomus cerebriforme TaxID=658196 RepID=A0A397TIL6_9GLOM|nr:hypothetical protein C1645_813668 [Glomus cerebriforme]